MKQIAANRLNATKSSGPRTPEGRAVSRMNALKHGILSKEVLVRGLNIKESNREFTALHEQFRQDLKPVGITEEMLVGQIVTAHWRLRRALMAESGEIALSVDGGNWKRESASPKYKIMLWELDGDPVSAMSYSAMGNRFMENSLKAVRNSVEQAGELTQAAVQSVLFRGKPYSLTEKLEKLRLKSLQKPDEVSTEDWRVKQKEQTLAFLNRELSQISWSREQCEERERKEESARQAAAVLPSIEVLDKIMRYETKLERQMYRAMAQLERLQRMRQGEAVPAPLSVEVSDG